MAAFRLCDPDHVRGYAIEAEQRLIVYGKRGLDAQIELVLLVVVDEDIDMSDEAVKGQAM